MQSQFGRFAGDGHDNAAPEVGTREIAQGDQLFVWSMRQWLISACYGRCVRKDLAKTYQRLGCLSAIPDFDEFMCVLTSSARRSIELRCVAYPTLSQDERTLLRILQAQHSPLETETATKAAAGLIHDPVDRLCQAAAGYYQALWAAELEVSHWRTLSLIPSQENCNASTRP
ncbi:MAG: hypothetical protein AAGI24_14600 [Pseudomonadota bacterium]